MARCRCQEGSCGCAVYPGDGIAIDGEGTPRDPWVISAIPAPVIPYALDVADTASVDMLLTGDGTTAPWVVSAQAMLDPLIKFDADAFTVTGSGTEADPMQITLADGGSGTNVSFSDTTEVVFTESGTGTAADPLIVSADLPLIDFTGGTPGYVLTMDAGGVFRPGPATQAPAGSVSVGFGLTGDGSGASPFRLNLCSYDDLKAACAP